VDCLAHRCGSQRVCKAPRGEWVVNIRIGDKVFIKHDTFSPYRGMSGVATKEADNDGQIRVEITIVTYVDENELEIME
jgi:hypothetical protein